MHLSIPSKKTISQALGLLLLNIIAMWTWALINVYIVPMPFWSDALFGASLVLLTIALSPLFPEAGKYKKILYAFSGILTLVGVIMGGVYAAYNSMPIYSNRWIISPLIELTKLLQNSFYSKSFTYIQILQLTLAYIALGFVALLFSILFKNAFYNNQKMKSFQRKIDKTRIALRWRVSRVFIWGGRITFFILFLMLVPIGLAGRANAFVPDSAIIETRTFTGPNASPAINALIIASQDGTLYAGTDAGVYRSRDGGVTWEAASAGLTSTSVLSLMQDSGGTLYAGTEDSVYRSKDRGTTWKTANTDLSRYVRSLLQDNRDGTLYAGTYAGVQRSRDGGVTWEAASAGLTSTSVLSLLQDSDGTLYAGTDAGVYRSRDGGVTWEAASAGMTTSTSVLSLMQDSDDTLYAGTDDGIYRSRDGGVTWEAASAGLTSTYVLSLMQDSGGTLYAGTEDSVYRSKDRGTTWETANTNLLIRSLLQDSDGTLYAGTDDSGLYRSRDGGVTWEAANVGLTSTFVRSLLQDNRDGTLYAGTDDSGLYRSRDGGVTWEAASAGLTSTSVLSLLQDNRDGTLYAGTDDSGLYRSRDGGVTWEAANTGLTSTSVRSLLQDSRDGTLYAGTGGGVYRSRDGGVTWEAASAGLTSTSVRSLLQDSDGTLYAGTDDSGLYRSRDGGVTWEAASAGLTSTSVLSLLQDGDGRLYAGTDGGVFRSRDGGVTWEWQLFGSWQQSYLMYMSMPDWALFENLNDEQFALSFNNLSELSAQSKQGEKTGRYYYVWGATIMEIKVGPSREPVRSPFWALRTWAEFGFKPRWSFLVGGFFLMLLFWNTFPYASSVWSSKTPPWKLLSKGEMDSVGKPNPNPVVQQWDGLIHNELITFGDVTPEDLLSVPALLRKQVMDSYLRQNENNIAIQRRKRNLVLLAGVPLKNWQIAWRRVADDFGKKAGLSDKGRSQVASLAEALSGVLGFSLGEYREIQSICAWRVEAPALRLNLPQRFPLIFVADPNPGEETVRLLFDMVSVLKETSNFTLVIPLEPESPDVDIPFALRRAIDASPYAHDFVVLSQKDTLDILVARYPERMLVQHISRQVDLGFISPFIVNGPVPPQMFFGRDKEIRNLVDHAGKRNFAIVGNRKIGKTSLLNRVEARVLQQEKAHLVRLDCQAVRESEDFYTAIQSALGIQLGEALPSVLGMALRAEQKQNTLPLVLMLDEVDALLAAEKTQGEPLLSILRELANEHSCSFIFCGSKVLAQQLHNPDSAMFNFPETISLPYLSREEMDDVIVRPLETLGIHMPAGKSLLDAVWAITSGHPNLTQYVGRSLVNAANARQDRTVNVEGIEALWGESGFVQFYFDTIWGAATHLEKLITLLMPPSDFTVGNVENALTDTGLNIPPAQVDTALEMLLIYSVLERNGKLYRFVPQAFHKLLELNYEKERLIAREREKCDGEVA